MRFKCKKSEAVADSLGKARYVAVSHLPLWALIGNKQNGPLFLQLTNHN